MKYQIPGTLAYIKSAPQIHRVNLSKIPAKFFADSTRQYKAAYSKGVPVPDEDAVKFYCYNHLLSILSQNYTLNETLPEFAQQFGGAYLQNLSDQGRRMLHYLLLICTREARHLKSGSTSPFWQLCVQKHGPVFADYLRALMTMNEDIAVSHFMNTPPDMSIGEYMSGIARSEEHTSELQSH